MKFFYYIITILILFSCKAQHFDLKKSNVIIFQKRNDMKIHPFDDDMVIYNSNKLNIKIYRWRNEDMGYYRLPFHVFTNINNDTMILECHCKHSKNYFFKNMEFKKGIYKLKVKNRENIIEGFKIKTTQQVQNISFKHYKFNKKNIVSFKDLKFVEIDMNDTTNIKIEKIK